MPPMLPRVARPSMVLQSDRKSTRLNSSHSQISYAVFCLKKKKNTHQSRITDAIFPYYIYTFTTSPPHSRLVESIAYRVSVTDTDLSNASYSHILNSHLV